MCRKLVRAILKNKDKGLFTRVLPRLRSLFQIFAVKDKIRADSVSLIWEMKRKAGSKPPDDDSIAVKVRSHAICCLWLIQERLSINKLNSLLKKEITQKMVKLDTLKEWNSCSTAGILNRRRLPLTKWRKKPPIWRSEAFNGETRSLLLKS